MKKITMSLLSAAALTTSGIAIAQIDATSTLPNAKPGECYAKVIIPAKFETRTEDVVVSDASEKIEIIPSKYSWGEEKILVQEASFKLAPIPSIYETVTERIETQASNMSWVLSTPGGRTKSAGASLVAYARGAGLPADSATAGQCYVEYYKPAQFRTDTQQLVKKEASESIEVIPPKYDWTEEKIVIEEASTKVMKVPAVYESLTEKVMISPATTVWKKGRGPKQRIDNTTGEIMCLVEVPAKYKTISKRVIKTPPSTKTIEIPAKYATQRIRKLVEPAREVRKSIPATFQEITKRAKVSDETVSWYLKGSVPGEAGKPTGNKLCLNEVPAQHKTITKRVLKSPAATKRIEIPAKYKTVKVRKLDQPASEKRIPIPARTDTISKRVKVQDERLEWRSVLCETNTTLGLIKRVQEALKAKGLNPGPLDGNLGGQTLSAINEYQRKNSMARGGLTMSTLKSLGVSP